MPHVMCSECTVKIENISVQRLPGHLNKMERLEARIFNLGLLVTEVHICS